MGSKKVTWEEFTEFFGYSPDEVVADSFQSRPITSDGRDLLGHAIVFERFVRDEDGHRVFDEKTLSFVSEEVVIRVRKKGD